MIKCSRGNLNGFRRFLLTANILPLKIFLLCKLEQQNMQSRANHKSFPYVMYIVDEPENFPPERFYRIQFNPLYNLEVCICIHMWLCYAYEKCL